MATLQSATREMHVYCVIAQVRVAYVVRLQAPTGGEGSNISHGGL